MYSAVIIISGLLGWIRLVEVLNRNAFGPTYLEVKEQFCLVWSGRYYLSAFRTHTIDTEKKKQSIFVSHSQPLNHSIELLWSSYCLPREGPIFIPPPGFPLTQQLHCHLGRKPESKHCFIWSASVLKKYPSSLSILLPSEEAGCCFCEEWLPPFDSRALWRAHAKKVALLLPRITIHSTLQWHPCLSFPFHMRI